VSALLYAGIDLGGTKIAVIVADEAGEVRGNARVATEAQRGPEAVIKRIVETVREACAEAGLEPGGLAGAGVAAPGPIDRDEGVITDPPNLPGWHNVPLARALTERLGVRAVLENDANCGAIGEHAYGAGRGYRDMIYITLSTGVGGGIIIGNQIYAGASGAAGEIGHIAVAPDGPPCGAGHIGCLEAFSSGTAIARRAQEMIDAGMLPRTARIAERNPPLDAEDVYLAGQQGEAEAAAIVERAGRYLGIGLASVINAFNPQCIVLGGGLINMGDALLGPAVETARMRAFPQSFGDVRIVEWELGEQGTALGALVAARNRQRIERG
jgi:glucokinase